MRIAIAGFMHESNTFAVFPTTLDNFTIHRGDAVIDHYRPTFHEMAGFIRGAEEYDFDLHPLIGADATPAGALTAATYETILGELLALGAEGRHDGNGRPTAPPIRPAAPRAGLAMWRVCPRTTAPHTG